MKKLKPIICCLIILIFAVNVLLYFQFTIDDAYITFRHSLNLIQYGELSWNTSGPLQEAFTNPLFVILGTLGPLVNIKPELPIKLINFLILLIWIYRINKISKHQQSKYICIVLLLTSPLVFIHAFAGLETFVFAYLLFEFFCAPLASLRSLTIAFCLLICRPEGYLFIFTTLLLAALKLSAYLLPDLKISKQLSGNKFPILSKSEFVLCMCIITLCASFMAYKVYYFSDIFSNTYYAKSAAQFSTSTFIYTLRSAFPWIVSSLILLAGFNQSFEKKYYFFLIYFITAVYLRSELAQNYASRFWFQLYAPFFIYFISTMPVFIQSSKVLVTKKGQYGDIKNYSLVISIIAVLGVTINFLRANLLFDRYYLRYANVLKSHVSIGKIINQSTNASDSIYSPDAGLIPFYANRLAYDPIGLGTKEIALYKGDTTKLLNFLERTRPSVFILYGLQCEDRSWSFGPEFKKEFQYMRQYKYEFTGGIQTDSSLCMNIYSAPQNSFELTVNLRKWMKSYKKLPIFLPESPNTISLKDQSLVSDLAYSYQYLFSPLSTAND